MSDLAVEIVPITVSHSGTFATSPRKVNTAFAGSTSSRSATLRNFMAGIWNWRLISPQSCVCNRAISTEILKGDNWHSTGKKTSSNAATAANDAKKALLERFKARPAEDDPQVQARKAERQAILEAREKRARREGKAAQGARGAGSARTGAPRSRGGRAPQARGRASGRRSENREQQELERIALELAEEAERKAKRDARYAARKSRKRGGRS